MIRALRKTLAVIAALSVLGVLILSLAWWSVHTAWFAALVRIRLVSVLQKATGGRVEMQRFRFDPDALHAGISRLVIHGTEPAGSPPLLTIESLDVGLKLLSVWRRDVDVESIVVKQPQIHLIVNADGTTNIPQVKRRSEAKNPVEQLLDLKAKHLEIDQGLFEANKHDIPFSLSTQDIALLLDYNYDGASYDLGLRTEAIQLAGTAQFPNPLKLDAHARLFRDHADIASLRLTTNNDASTLQLSGKLTNFANISLDSHLDADISMDDLTRLGDIDQQLHNGRGHAAGSLRFDAASGKFVFDGKASAQKVDLTLPQFVLRDMNASADMLADNDGMRLSNAEGSARGAHFAGKGVIKDYQFLQVEGRVWQVALKEVGAYLTPQPFPWSGIAHGTAHASARLTGKDADFIIGAKVDVDPANTGIPTSGNVEVTYYDSKEKVEFGRSTLRLPNSIIDFSGSLDGDLAVKADNSNLAELEPLIPILGARLTVDDLPEFTQDGGGHFEGKLKNLFHAPAVEGRLSLTKFRFRKYPWDSLTADLSLSANSLSIPQFDVRESGVSLAGSADAELANWTFNNDSPLHFNSRFTNLDIVKTASVFTASTLPLIQGIASGRVNIHGTLNHPQGTGNVEVKNLDAYGELLNNVEFNAELTGNSLKFEKGRVESGLALLSFSGSYRHNDSDWTTGDVELKADTNGFPIASLSTIRKFVPALNAHAEVHLEAVGKFRNKTFEPLRINGDGQFAHITLNGRPMGNASLVAVTRAQSAIDFKYSGDLRDTKFHGTAQADLTPGTPIRGDLQLDRIGFADLKSLITDAKITLPIDGYLDGSAAFDGSLEDPARIHARGIIKELQLNTTPHVDISGRSSIPDIALRNDHPIEVDLSGGVLSVSRFEIDGRDTSVKVTGSAPLFGGKPVAIQAVGKADLGLFSIFDPNVRSAGSSELAANIAGPINALNITGALEIRNGSFFLPDVPNGLSDVNGTVVFSRNRATIQKMNAHSGGGDISLGGSLSFGEGNPLVYHLEANARNVRVRYANSISVTANSDLRLSGTSVNSILSGTLTITRIVFTPNADAGNLLAAASSFTANPADQGDFISGLHLDVGVESSPNLQVSTNLSRDVEAEIQLRLRGTPDHPIVLGNINANQGDIKIFGTRFTLNRGEVSFVNTVKVEPVLDLDLETQARGVTVDITVAGTPSKLNFNYRSDPPLQPRDIIALLTVGRTPGVGATSNAQGASDATALSSGVNSVLGQAISPVSNRLSKLFGITNIKIDPFVQGITNTPQARLSVEQQISRDVTVTYVTNLSQTSEQIFRFEWALSKQFSVVAIRDDNGEFGIDFQYKKRFK